MCKEYIEREAASRVLCDACGNAACPKGLIPRCSYYEKMQSIPAADVREVKWIPVTERLPDDIDEEVLVCTEDYGVSGLGFVTVATYGVSGWLECWERKTYLTAVTHWMPLPQPPKEE